MTHDTRPLHFTHYMYSTRFAAGVRDPLRRCRGDFTQGHIDMNELINTKTGTERSDITQAAVRAVDDIDAAHKATAERLRQAHEEIAKLRRQLHTPIEGSAANYEVTVAGFRAMCERFNELTSQRNELHDLSRRNERSIAGAIAKVVSLTEQNTTLVAQLNTANSDNAELHDKVAKLDAVVVSLQAELTATSRNRNEAADRVIELSAERDALQAERDASNEWTNFARAVSARHNAEARLAAKHHTLQSTEAELSKVRASLVVAEAERDTLRTENVAYSMRVENDGRRMAAMADELETTKRERDTLRTENTYLHGRVVSLTRRLESVRLAAGIEYQTAGVGSGGSGGTGHGGGSGGHAGGVGSSGVTGNQ